MKSRVPTILLMCLAACGGGADPLFGGFKPANAESSAGSTMKAGIAFARPRRESVRGGAMHSIHKRVPASTWTIAEDPNAGIERRFTQLLDGVVDQGPFRR